MKLKEYGSYLVILIAVILIRTFIVTPVSVSGSSMYSTLDDGDILLLKKYDKSYERFDIVVLKYDNDKLIKRIIGLPGDYIEYSNGKLYINGKSVSDKFSYLTSNFNLKELGYDKIPDNYYLVLGDNRKDSTDSRIIGLIKKDDIKGTTDFSLWPLKKIK